MMHRPTDEHPPPKSTDLEGWRQAIKAGRLAHLRLEDIVAALQDLGPNADKTVLNPLAKHLSDALLHILRGLVSINHRNRGDDIIDRTYDRVIEAVFQPGSADGRALRDAFTPRVTFRLKDALASEARAAQNQERHEERRMGRSTRRGADGDSHDLLRSSDLSRVFDENMDVKQILEQVADDRKRLAFQLYMDGVPFKSKKSDSISEALDVSDKTAQSWVREVQQLLLSVPAVQEILQSTLRSSP